MNSKKSTEVFYNENDVVLNNGEYMHEFLVVNEPNSVRMTRTLPNGNNDVIGTLPVGACIGLLFHTCWDSIRINNEPFDLYTSQVTYRVTKDTSFTKYNSIDDIFKFYGIVSDQRGKFHANLVFQVVPGLCKIPIKEMMKVPKELITFEPENTDNNKIIETSDTGDKLKNFFVILVGTCSIYLDNGIEVGTKYDLEIVGESSFRSEQSRRTANVRANNQTKTVSVIKFNKDNFNFPEVQTELRFRVTENERLNNEHYLDLDYNLLKRKSQFGRNRQQLII